MGKSTCTVDGCERTNIFARGMCNSHYKRWSRYGDPLAGQAFREPIPEMCGVQGCGRRAEKRRWCGKHYARFLRHGDPEGGRDRIPAPAECNISGCSGQPMVHGWCTKHYSRFQAGIIGDEYRPCIQCGLAISLYPDGQNGRRIRSNVASCDGCRRPPNPITAKKLRQRDGPQCGICGEDVDSRAAYPDRGSPSVDHVVPYSRGGSNTADNCQLAHLICNLRKNNRTDYAPIA